MTVELKSSNNMIRCIAFKNHALGGDIHTWVYSIDDVDGHAEGLEKLGGMNHIELLSHNHASVQGAQRA